jgi:hypothetical protein
MRQASRLRARLTNSFPDRSRAAATSPNIRTEVADATDPDVPENLLDKYEPQVLILVAGANPVARPLHEHTWQTSLN